MGIETGLRTDVAVVTGAAHGIGLATAQALAGSGRRLVAVDYDATALDSADLPKDTIQLHHDLAESADVPTRESEGRHLPARVRTEWSAPRRA